MDAPALPLLRARSPARTSSSKRSILFRISIKGTFAVRFDAKLGQHLQHIGLLRFRLIMGCVSDMGNDVRLKNFFQRGAEGRDQFGRQVGDEPDRVGKDGLRSAGEPEPGAWSGRGSRTGGPWPAPRIRSGG